MSLFDLFSGLMSNPTAPTDNTLLQAQLQDYLGTQPTPDQLSVADTHGIPAALKLYEGDPEAKVSSILPANEVKAAGFDPNGTVGEYIQHHQDMAQDTAQDAPQQPQQTPQATSVPTPPPRPSDASLGVPSTYQPPQAAPSTYQAQDPATIPPAPAANAPYSTYAATVRQIESGGNDQAVSPTGATGRYQFTKGTWDQYGSGSRMDPNAQEAAMQSLTADDSAKLTKALGRPPTDAELYLAHQQGAGGAIKLLSNPDKTPADLGLGTNVKLNGGDPNAPASAFVSQWNDNWAKYSGSPGAAGGANAPQVAGGDPSSTPDATGTIPKPDANPSMYAKLATFLNGDSSKNTKGGGFADGLLGVGSALMARDNPTGAKALKDLMAKDGSKQQYIGMNQDGTAIRVFDPDTGEITSKPIDGGFTVGKNGVKIPAAQATKDAIDLKKNPATEQEQAIAKQIAAYQTPMPPAYSSRSPEAIRMRAILATQYPDFQAQNYQTAQKMMQDATSGKLGVAKNALETATGHLDDLSTAANALGNGNISMMNTVANTYGLATGSTPQAVFNTIRQGLSDEMMKTYRGGGAPSEKEAAEFQKLMDPSMSPQQLKASVGTFAEMLQSKVEANERQYSQGVGKTLATDKPLFAPDKQAILDRLQDKGQDAEDAPRVPQAASQSQGGITTVQNATDYANIPKGTQYVGPDGKIRTKQ